jgi:hypothetical protein
MKAYLQPEIIEAHPCALEAQPRALRFTLETVLWSWSRKEPELLAGAGLEPEYRSFGSGNGTAKVEN